MVPNAIETIGRMCTGAKMDKNIERKQIAIALFFGNFFANRL